MPATAQLERNIRRYVIFAAAAFTPFMLPVIVLFWQENGLDMFDVYLLQGIFAFAVVLLEVPTGMVADRLGKRASLIAAMAIDCAGFVCYALGHSFLAFLAAELLLALGASLYSGAGSALLFDSLKALGREAEYQRLDGRARAVQMVVFAACNLLGGVIGSYSYRATVCLSAAGPLVGLGLALTLVEVQRPHPAGSWRAGLAAYRDLIAGAGRFVIKHRLVRWQILFLGILTGSSTWLLWLYQPYMQWTGLPVWAFGGAFTIYNLFAALASHHAHRVERRSGRRGTLVLLSALQIAPPFLMAWLVGPASFLLVLGHQAVRGLALPILNARILRYTYADKRATVLSIGSLAGRLFFAATAPFIGLVTRHSSMPGGLAAQGAVLTVLLGGMLAAYLRIPEKYFRVKEAIAARQ